jgi:hypothetical protein
VAKTPRESRTGNRAGNGERPSEIGRVNFVRESDYGHQDPTTKPMIAEDARPLRLIGQAKALIRLGRKWQRRPTRDRLRRRQCTLKISV